MIALKGNVGCCEDGFLPILTHSLVSAETQVDQQIPKQSFQELLSYLLLGEEEKQISLNGRKDLFLEKILVIDTQNNGE